ncbi:Fork-head transcriptional regulator 2 [Trametes pubescens]|uniref:Fork-head transcriptional regulator 2 n=1 Tax=Trametes pubescens TaxID=154538 RepID=A0A1M2VSG1_TRAPU|nr:Fork-head transcriptional regulator 2 [Trametes pubescens]
MATTAPALLHDTPQGAVFPHHDPQDAPQDKISAYYSLVFPNFVYYLQTLNVTIGRRCVPANTASSSDSPQVDVDLGPLKSVSRLHAKIEYDEDEERFVLIVIGRNGAWVDGVWSGSGSKVPLGDRAQIQIASRTFFFVLPPSPPPEDSPSPSSQSSGHRARSPSVDITTYSPPSSIPSESPPPANIPTAAPKVPPLPEISLPNSNAIPHLKSNSKKRKKSDAPPPPLPPPEVMPPKPPLTYAQLCYRAIKALGGKASLQEICQWIKDSYDWYKYCSKDWESSVRHNLSSNVGFKKHLRSKEEKGKGALWMVDDAHEHTFEELDARKQNVLVGGVVTKDGKIGGKKGKAVVPLEPPLRRSVKGDSKGVPLPPPLTSIPLALKSSTPTFPSSSASSSSPPLTTAPAPVKTEPVTVSYIPSPPSNTQASFHATAPAASMPLSTGVLSTGHTIGNVAPSQALPSSSAAPTPSSFPTIPASVRIPIVVGPVPSTTATGGAPAPPKPIVLHENTLILNPEIFSHLTPQHLLDLEALGAQKALEILQAYIVRYYKEKLKAEGGRGRGRGRPRRGRGGATGRGSTPAGSVARTDTPMNGPFTTAPLPPRVSKSTVPSPAVPGTGQDFSGAPPPASSEPPADAPSPIVVIDDDEDDAAEQEPVAKRRRLEEPVIDLTGA